MVPVWKKSNSQLFPLFLAGSGELGHLQRTQTKRASVLLHQISLFLAIFHAPIIPQRSIALALCVIVKSVLTRRVFLKGLALHQIDFGGPKRRIFSRESKQRPKLGVGTKAGTCYLGLHLLLVCHFLDSLSCGV